MDLGLKNKIALVTGASRGLGFATARLLAQEGARVAINGRNAAALEKAAAQIAAETGAKTLALAGDMVDPATPARLMEKINEAWGGLDLLVANAGGPPAGTFESFDDEVWQKAVELSFLSQVRLIREALPLLKQSDCASVLTITSYSVKQPIPNLVLSNSIRAATVGLTKSLALELGGQGIRFNSILPGWTETERVVNLMSARAQNSGRSIDEETARQAADSPLGRMGQPEEFGRAAVFLLSPAASYITGVMLTVDGGMYKGTL
ncbi:MAG TPA: SDR family oxidoreductase [Anaerolineaceae bacterium]|nr:SDR family oxidoreductase [Anaerolineaceae bacterium]